MNENSWLKFYYKFLDWEWYKISNTKDLFIHCLLKANRTDKKFQGIEVKRGSFITSVSNLAEELSLTVRQVRTALNHLKSTNNLTIKTTNKFSMITVVGYEKYQENKQVIDKQVTRKRQTNDIQTTTTKEYKNEEYKNEDIKDIVDKPPDIKKFIKPNLEELENYCLEKKLKVDCESFLDYYNSNGWKIGKNPMKDWQATLRNWHKRNQESKKPEWIDKKIEKEEMSLEELQELEEMFNKL